MALSLYFGCFYGADGIECWLLLVTEYFKGSLHLHIDVSKLPNQVFSAFIVIAKSTGT